MGLHFIFLSQDTFLGIGIVFLHILGKRLLEKYLFKTLVNVQLSTFFTKETLDFNRF